MPTTRPRKIYVASSWRNEYQPIIVETLRTMGHEVYDFRNPPKGTGFGWSKIDPDWQRWSTIAYFRALEHPTALEGFRSDYEGMKWADACVLVHPCGRSAHLEAGWMMGQGKQTVIYVPEPERIEPDLMYLLGGESREVMTNSIHGIAHRLLNWQPPEIYREADYTVEALQRRVKELETRLAAFEPGGL